MKFFKNLLTACLVFSLLFGFDSPLPTSAQSQPGVNVIQSTAQGITFEVIVPWQEMTLDPVDVQGRSYFDVSLPGYATSDQPGAPKLPVLTQAIGIPGGVALEVNITPMAVHQQVLDKPIIPVLTQRSSPDVPFIPTEPFTGVTPDSFVEMDRAVYEYDQAYPGIMGEVLNMGMFRQQRVAGIKLYPVQYHPISNALMIYESFVVEVKFVGQTLQGTLPEAQAESEHVEEILRANLLNYDSAKDWRFSSPAVTSDWNQVAAGEASNWQPPAPAWKIAVREEGMYRLTYAQLDAAGLPVTTLVPDTLKMFHLGEEIAIQVSTAVPGALSPGDFILFYGQQIDSKYTQENIYWLTYDGAAGLRIQVEDGTPSGSPAALSYSQNNWFEENLNYASYVPGEDHFERYMGPYIYNKVVPEISRSVVLDHVYDGSGRLKIDLLGFLSNISVDPDHHAIITIFDTESNVVFTDSVTWDGITWEHIDFELPLETLTDGTYTIKISSPNNIELIYLDWFEISYARNLVAVGDLLQFDYDQLGTREFTIGGFSTDALFVFDLSNPAEITAISGAEITTAGSDYQVRFDRAITAAKSFWVGTAGTFLPVLQADIRQDTPSDWGSTLNSADYIVITHRDFWTQADQLAAFRAGQGMRTALVDVQDIYDEFAYGIVGVQAIKDFLAFAYQNWQAPAPTFVVLIGDGHFDPNNYQGYGRKNFIPPFLAYIDPDIGETAADNRYVSIIGGDPYPEMMLGRLAVNSPAEAQAFVNKIIAYEEEPNPGDWQQQVLAVSDSYESGWVFPNISDNLLTCCLPNTYEAERVYLGVTHPDVGSARSAILSGINAGKFLVNYIGHASSSMWSAPYPGMLITNNISSLTNLNKYPVVLSMACWDGYYIYPNPVGNTYDALAEVFTKAGNKGAVAQWSATGTGVARGHEYLNQGFFNAIFRDGLTTLGQATSAGKFYLWTSGTNLDLMETYLLFGDPATNMMLTMSAVDDTYYMVEDGALPVDVEQGVMRNDIIPAGVHATVDLVSTTDYGVLEINLDGSFVYTPDENYFGIDSFTYRLMDGETYSNTATVRINVASVNDPPVAHNQSLTTPMETMLDITLTADDDGSGISMMRFVGESFAFDDGLHNSGLTFNILTQPTQGILDGEAGSANQQYTPGEGYAGPDSFTFEACDYQYCSEPATVSITVTSGIPVAFGQSVETDEDTSLDITLTGVAHEGTLTFQVETPPTNGILSGTAPDLTYTPDLNFNGSDSFTFSVTDDSATSAAATIDITIKPVNDAPLAEDQAVSVNQGESTAITLTASDVEGDSLTYQVTTQPKNGKLSGVAPNLVYTPDANFSGEDNFTFRAFDGDLYGDPATVTITINPYKAIFLPLIHR